MHSNNHKCILFLFRYMGQDFGQAPQSPLHQLAKVFPSVMPRYNAPSEKLRYISMKKDLEAFKVADQQVRSRLRCKLKMQSCS